MQRLLRTTLAICLLTILANAAGPVQAQDLIAKRKYLPAIIPLQQIPIAGQPLDSLALFAYDAGSSSWKAIPFQIDEKDSSGFVRGDGIASALDELVFMIGDAGDQADTDNWPEGMQPVRWEIELADPMALASSAYVYLYKFIDTKPTVPGYLDYAPDANGAGADTVFGRSYIEAHDKKGWHNFLSFKQADGSMSPNVLDRLKLRVAGKGQLGFITIEYEANEDTNLIYQSVEYSGGPVRGFRKVSMILDPLHSTLLQLPFDLTLQYFPYSLDFGGGEVTISDSIADLAGVKLARESVDFSENISGKAQFFSDSNPSGVPIDGNPDPGVDTTIPVSPDVAWFAANSDYGTLLNLVEVPNVGTAQQLYYRDDASGGTADNTQDTGDMKSFGDMGMMITGDKIRGTISFDLKLFYLPRSDNPVATAEATREAAAQPLAVSGSMQNRTPTSVASGDLLPMDFALENATPNPFAPASGPLKIGFNLSPNVRQARVAIYNILGQEIVAFDVTAKANAASQIIVWNGRDRNGRLMPAGLYFYALRAGQRQQIKKLMLLR